MALTHLISNNDDFKSFFKNRIPSKKEFSTISGHSPFSKEYVTQAPYALENKHNSSTVGTAFDYLARWIIARIICDNKEQSYTDLTAEHGISRCRIEAKRLDIDLEKEYNVRLQNCKHYVYGTGVIDDLIETAIFFAKLEQVFRRNLMPFQVDMEHIFSVEEEVVIDLKNLISVFQQVIVDTHIVHENSIVVFNPTFGGASHICGGADADIYIDGVLYDFKCTNKTGYVWNDVAQIYGYYLLSKVAKHYDDTDDMLHDYEILRIAFYRARYGEIEYFDMNEADYDIETQDFIQLLGEDEYEHYFEQQRKLEEKEKSRKLELENRIECYKRVKQYLGINSYFEYVDSQLNKHLDETSQLRLVRSALFYASSVRIKDTISSSKLKIQMDSKNISINDLAKLLDLSPSSIRNWLNEKNNPKVLSLIEMTQIFECSVTDLIKTIKTTPSITRSSSATTEISSSIKKGKKGKKAKRTKIKKRKQKKHH